MILFFQVLWGKQEWAYPEHESDFVDHLAESVDFPMKDKSIFSSATQFFGGVLPDGFKDIFKVWILFTKIVIRCQQNNFLIVKTFLCAIFMQRNYYFLFLFCLGKE